MSETLNEEELKTLTLQLANRISTVEIMPEYYSTYTIKADKSTGADKKEQKEIVEQTCITFTELLLSITPFKAKEFVEKNCNRVRRAIMKKLNEVEDE